MSSHTLSWVLDATTQYFEKQRVDAPRATAEHLAARLLRCKRAELPLHAAQELTEAQLEAMRRGMKRAADGEPLQYILGQWDFRSLTLRTDSRALIPRPETEQLVDLVLASNALRAADAPLVLDYGTGSGCIALSIAKECPKARVFAVDISSDALALAAENAASLELQDRVFLIDLTQRDLSDCFDPCTFHVLVSNPPYIPSRVVDTLDKKVLSHEPRMALDGGEDGMDLLRQISDEASMLLAPRGELFFELDAESAQAPKMCAYLESLGFEQTRKHRDYSGAERFLSALLPDGY